MRPIDSVIRIADALERALSEEAPVVVIGTSDLHKYITWVTESFDRIIEISEG